MLLSITTDFLLYPSMALIIIRSFLVSLSRNLPFASPFPLSLNPLPFCVPAKSNLFHTKQSFLFTSFSTFFSIHYVPPFTISFLQGEEGKGRKEGRNAYDGKRDNVETVECTGVQGSSLIGSFISSLSQSWPIGILLASVIGLAGFKQELEAV